jgi:hypothetical protein
MRTNIVEEGLQTLLRRKKQGEIRRVRGNRIGRAI